MQIKKRSYSAAIHLAVLARLLKTEEFSGERLGLHFLRGHWAPGRLLDPEVPGRVLGVQSTAAEKLWQRSGGADVPVTTGCPESAGVIERRVRARGVGAASTSNDGDGGVDGGEEEEEEEEEEDEEVTAAEKEAALLAASDGCFHCSDESDGSGVEWSGWESDGSEEAELEGSVFRCPDESDGEDS